MRGRSRQQLSFGDGFIDPSLFSLDEELTQVDSLLTDRKLLAPFEEVFDPTMGRPGTPIDVYLRMLYLKFRWGLSYEEVEHEVRERIPWRFFCHLSLQDTVPDATTLIKLNQRFGEERIATLNKLLVKHLIKTKSIKPRRIRIDSTTLEANITYPTDITLMHQVVKTLTRTAQKLGQKVANHTRATKRALAQMGASLKSKSKDKKARLHKSLRATSRLAQDTLAQCRTALKRLKRRQGTSSLQQRFEQHLAVAEQLLEQTEQKLAGCASIPERLVSFYDPEARPICKGKLAKPTEFGRTLQLVQDASGLLLDYEIHLGNPSDKEQLLPLTKRFKKHFGRAPTELAADKGYYRQDNLTKLKELGVRRAGIAKIGRLTGMERRRQKSRWFKRLFRFRCGMEASISMLKRCFGLGKILARGSPSTAIWVGLAILSYNLWQMT
jgi:IS5 family transposase